MKPKSLIFISLIFCAFLSGCEATPVTVPRASSSDLGVRSSQVSRMDEKYKYETTARKEPEKAPRKDAVASKPAIIPKTETSKPAPPENYAADKKRMALVIGNADYVSGGSLDNPANDARSMESALKNLGFEVVKYENADQRNMRRAIDLFGAKLKGYDTALFFYAGHGVQVKGSNYLIPVNANLKSENDVEYDCVDAGRVLAKMEDAGTRTNIVILDACRDNPFERSWRRGARGAGLAFMNAPSGSLIAYATSPGKTASDGTGSNGLYTSSLLEHIFTPNIKIEEVFKRVRSSVMRKTGKEQTPWESTSLTGDFYFKTGK